MNRAVWYSAPVFAKPLYSALLLVVSLLAWLAASFGGGSSMITFWPGMLALAGAGVLGGFGLARGFHGRANLWCIGAVMAFVAWILIRGALSEVKYLARPDMLFAIAGLISYTLVVAHFETSGQRRVIFGVLMLILLSNLGWGFWQKYSGHYNSLPHSALSGAIPTVGEFLGWTDIKRSSFGNEITGFYISENHFSGMLEMMAPLALAVFLLGRCGLLMRLAALLVYLIAVLGCLYSTSRAGQACMFGGSLVVLGLWWMTRVRLKKLSGKKALIVGGVALAVLVAGMIAGSLKMIRQQHGSLEFGDELDLRLGYSRLAWEQFLKRPLDGTGARSFEYEERAQRDLNVERWLWYTDVDTDAIFTHNDWMQLLGDYGGLGGMLGLLVVGTHLVSGLNFIWKRSKQLHEEETSRKGQAGSLLRDDRMALTLGAIASLIALATHSLIDFNFHIAFNVVLMAILLAFLANPGRAVLKNAVDAEGDALIPRHGVLVRAGLIIFALVASGYPLLYGMDWMKGDRQTRLGERMRSENNYFQGSEALVAVSEIDPANYSALMTLGYLNMDEAARASESMKPKNAAEKEFQTKVQNSYLRRACEVFAQAYPLYPQNPYIGMAAGSCFSLRGDYTAAEQWFSRAFQYGKAVRRLYFEYGMHLIRKAALSTGDLRTQIELSDKAINQYYLPALEKLRTIGPDHQIRADELNSFRAWNLELKEQLKKEEAATPAAPVATPPPPAAAPVPPAQ